MAKIEQIFRRNSTLWSEQQKQIVQDFFLSNVFFSAIYQKKKFNQIARICFYRKLQAGQRLFLENNNRSEAIVLLTGQIRVRKKERKPRKKPRKPRQLKQKQGDLEEQAFQYNQISHLKQFNQTSKLNSQSIVQSAQGKNSQILFIPCALFYKLQEDIQGQRVLKIYYVLERFFFRLKKKQLHQFSQSNCLFREFKMNNYIYRARQKPEQVFILIQGVIKLQKPEFSQQNFKQTILITAGRIFGQTDLKLEERTRNAVACSAHVQVLSIPKSSFVRFVNIAFPGMHFEAQNSQSTKFPSISSQTLRISRSFKVSPQKRGSNLPEIKRKNYFHQNSMQTIKRRNSVRRNSESEEKRQYELIRKSHMLVDLKQRPKRRFQLRNFSPRSSQQVKELLKKNKSKLKHLKQNSKFNLDESLLNL